MKIRATARYVRLSPTKALAFARLLKGMSIDEALETAEFSNQKAAALIGKTLKSAVANAANNAGRSPDDFYVEQVLVEKGPVMKRYWSRSRGMARPIQRKTSHLHVVLADDKRPAKKRS